MLERLHPRGPYDLDPGSLYRDDLAVLGAALDLADDQRLALLDELLPDRAEALLSSWERVYAIYRGSTRTTQQRRDAIVARRRYLPDFVPTTIEGILEQLTGVDVTLVEPGHFRCDDAGSLCDTADDVLDGIFVFFADLDHAAAVAAGVDRAELDEVIGQVEPAHTLGISRFNLFSCDDPYSLTDRDLLGA